MALTFNLPSQIVVQTSAQWAADNTVYSAKRILVTSDVYYGSTDQRKFKIADGVQTWSNLDYMPIEQVTTSTIGSAINGAASATPNDTDLVMSVDTSVAKKNTWTQIKAFLKTYFDTVYKATFTENTAFNKNFGTGTTNIVEIGSTLGNSLITSTDANGKLQTLTTATYPSLTELSYVKGLTSAVQTQLGTKLAKCHTLHLEHTQLGSGTASTSFYFAAAQATANTIGGALRRLPSAITGHIYTVAVHSTIQTTLAGSTQQATLKIYNFTAGTSVTVGTTIQYDAVGQSYVYTLGTPFAVTAGDDLYCEITFPAWSSTVPAGIIHYIDALIYGF